MKSKKIISHILLSSVILSGCATVQNYEWAAHSWEGAPASALLHRWGHPNQTEQLANGHRVYMYRTVTHGMYPVASAPGISPVRSYNTTMVSSPSRMMGDGSYAFECKTWFEVNPNGRITHVSFRGNDCVASEKRARARAYLRKTHG